MAEVKEITVKEAKNTTVKIGNIEVKAKLIEGVTYVPLRDFIDAFKKELEVTWDSAEGAGVDL